MSCECSYTYSLFSFFQEQDIHGVSVKNYTESIIDEIKRIREEQKNVSNLITVVIGEYKSIILHSLH